MCIGTNNAFSFDSGRLKLKPNRNIALNKSIKESLWDANNLAVDDSSHEIRLSAYFFPLTGNQIYFVGSQRMLCLEILIEIARLKGESRVVFSNRSVQLA